MTINIGQENVSVDDVEVPAVDFTQILDSGETITTVTVTQTAGTVATIGSNQTNSANVKIKGRVVEPGKAALFQLSGIPTAGLRTFRFQVVTNSSPARTLNREADINVI